MKVFRAQEMAAKERAAELARLNEDRPCPHCGASDLGDVILPELNQDECYEPQGTRWRKQVAVVARTLDRAVAYQCWSCAQEWPRRQDGA